MRFFCSLTGNYIISLLMLAVLFRTLMVPFTVKKRKTELKKVKLQPYVDKIKERYKDKTDQESVNQKNIEITNLYKSEKMGMASGCFSSLLQIPLFIAVYNVITNPLTHICRFSAETISAIEDLSLSITQKPSVSQVEMLGILKQNLTAFSSVPEIAQKYTSSAELPELTFLNGYIDASRIPSLTEASVYTFVPLIVFVATLLITVSSSYFFNRSLFSFKELERRVQNISSLVSIIFSSGTLAYFSTKVAVAVSVYWVFNSLLDTAQRIIINKCIKDKHITLNQPKIGEQ